MSGSTTSKGIIHVPDDELELKRNPESASPPVGNVTYREGRRRKFWWIGGLSLLALVLVATLILWDSGAKQQSDIELGAPQVSAERVEALDGQVVLLQERLSGHPLRAHSDVAAETLLYREARAALDSGDLGRAAEALDQVATGLAAALARPHELQYSQLTSESVAQVMRRYMPTDWSRLVAARAAVQAHQQSSDYVAYVDAFAQAVEQARATRLALQREVSALASEADRAGLYPTAAAYYSDLQAIDPDNTAARDFFRNRYYRPGQVHVAASGIAFVYEKSGPVGYFVSISEVDPRPWLKPSVGEDLESGVASAQLTGLLATLSILDQVGYVLPPESLWKTLLLENHATEATEETSAALTYNAFGLTHRARTLPEWARDDQGRPQALASDGSRSPAAVADLRLAFVPERWVPVLE